MTPLDRVQALLRDAAAAPGRIVALTGAGISAASGIPTFRGSDGFWTIGSANYRPEELATWAAFARMPAALWAWYLQRAAACRQAQPNAAHRALAAVERAFGDRFVLVTQNIDGLHQRGGSSAARTLEIHGSLHRLRCADGCSGPQPLPDDLCAADDGLDAATAARLRCRCGAWLRPHVLWFDEYYDEVHYRFDSALAAIDAAALLLVVGTTGATNLPNQIVERAAAQGTAVVVQNLEPSRFSALAERLPRGAFVAGDATEWVPRLASWLGA
jgi:NAD-dependent deacetylase